MTNKESIDRSFTAIPCLTVFTKKVTKGGIPKDLFYIILFLFLVSTVLMKNIIIGLVIGILYFILKKINKNDETTLEGLLKMNRKKYISY